jgi:putative DNA primase/helicase
MAELSLEQIKALVAAAQVAPAPAPDAEIIQASLLKFGAHDEGNAQATNLLYGGRFLQNNAMGWLHYTGTHWAQAGAEAALERAITATLEARIRAALDSGRADQYKDLIIKCVPNARAMSGAKTMLSSIVYADVDTFDTDPDLLNCKNGVVDLRTGEVKPHTPAQRFTYCAPVDYIPDAPNKTFIKWLTKAVGAEITEWLQLAVGYSATGHTSEEILFYLYGPPRSGKGTFTETLLAVMGKPLAKEIQFATFTAQRTGDSQNFDLAPLKPCRMVAASESNAYEKFNEAKIKALTGGNEIYCAHKHRDHFGYRPQFKIWLSTNHPVNADADDDAVWGRLRVVQFPESHLGKEDKRLKERMKTDAVLEGVLAWIVEGARKWYNLGAGGLTELESSRITKVKHRESLDNVRIWIDECCHTGAGFTGHSLLYLSYEKFCKDNGIEPKRKTGFSQSLIMKGFTDGRETIEGRQLRGFTGIMLV